jgi:hypothetical protein
MIWKLISPDPNSKDKAQEKEKSQRNLGKGVSAFCHLQGMNDNDVMQLLALVYYEHVNKRIGH